MGIACGGQMVIDLGATPLVLPHASWDLVYYERENPVLFVAMDWVIVEIAPGPAGPWTQVFFWGDTNPDTNTNIASFGSDADGEMDNELIPIVSLYGTFPFMTGVTIDADAFAGPGVYSFVRLTAPLGGNNDPAEVDAIEILP